MTPVWAEVVSALAAYGGLFYLLYAAIRWMWRKGAPFRAAEQERVRQHASDEQREVWRQEDAAKKHAHTIVRGWFGSRYSSTPTPEPVEVVDTAHAKFEAVEVCPRCKFLAVHPFIRIEEQQVDVPSHYIESEPGLSKYVAMTYKTVLTNKVKRTCIECSYEWVQS